MGGTIGSRLPNKNGEATEEIAIVSVADAPDSCVELRTAGVMIRAGKSYSSERST